MFNLNKNEKSWILYDVGNSAFILLVSTIIPIYFEYIAGNANISSVTYLAYWGYATSLVTILVAILGPIFGAMGDRQGKRKKLFLGFVGLGVLGCISLGFITSWIAFLIVFILAKTAYSITLIHYDSMLVDITTEDRVDGVSTSGFAWGYIGSCIPFVIGLLFILEYDWFGMSFQTAVIITFLIHGIWWFLCTMPLSKRYQQIHYVTNERKEGSFYQLLGTLKEIKKDKKILLFLISFFFYIDGVYTIIDMATVYGKALGLASSGLLLALLVTQFVAFPCSILFGKLSQKMNAVDLITVCIAAYLGIAVYAIFLSTVFQFWILAICVGMFQGAIQALSRSYYAKIIPKEKSGEYYGVLDICGKGASFLGVSLVSIISQFTNSTSKGIGIIPVLILVGLVLFRIAVKKESCVSENLVSIPESVI